MRVYQESGGDYASVYAAFPDYDRKWLRERIRWRRTTLKVKREKYIPWPKDAEDRLMRAYDHGGYKEAYAAFPDLERQTIRKKIRRTIAKRDAVLAKSVTANLPVVIQAEVLPRFDSRALAFQIAEGIAKRRQRSRQQAA